MNSQVGDGVECRPHSTVVVINNKCSREFKGLSSFFFIQTELFNPPQDSTYVQNVYTSKPAAKCRTVDKIQIQRST